VKRIILLFLVLLLSSCSRGNYDLLNRKMNAMENRMNANEVNIESNSKRIDSINSRLIAIEKQIEKQREKSKTYDNIPPAALIANEGNVQKDPLIFKRKNMGGKIWALKHVRKNENVISINDKNDKNDKAVYDVALADYKNFQYAKARSEFLNFLNKFKTSKLYDNAMFWLADAYFHIGDLNRSEQMLKKLIVQYPDKPVTKCGKTDAAMYLLTIIYNKKQDYKNKLYYKNMLTTKFPDSVYVKKIKYKTK